MEKVNRKQGFLVVLTITSVSCLLFFVNTVSHVTTLNSKIPTELFEKERVNTSAARNTSIVGTRGCQFEDFAVMNKQLKKYYQKLPPVNCATKKPLTLIRDGQLWINSEVMSLYGKGEVNCFYSYIYRKEQNWTHYDKDADSTIGYGECKVFRNPVNLTEDFVRVECHSENATVYKNTHALINKRRWPEPVPRNQDHPSVLIIGLDSLSRLNFRRQMPLTLDFLERFGFVEYLGYNKIGDNTFPNLVAGLTGRTTSELRKLCWKRNVYPMDECPFIWKNFSSLNYRTFYGEDMPTWSTFTYNKLGFVSQPADFYYRPYSLAARNLAKWESEMCYGYQHSVQHLLDYTLDFAVTHKNVPFFALSWEVRLTHEDFNEPQLADPLYIDFLNKLNSSGIFKDSVVFVMSDHGLRFGEFLETYQGYVEERLPAFWAKFPDWFVRKFPKAVANFRANSRKLTSPFDFHQTLLDLLNVSRLAEQPLPQGKNALRGQSLFSEVYSNRTCSQAGIDETWCTCQTQVAIRVSDPVVQSGARFVVRALNKLLAGRKECAYLSLSSALEARRKSSNLSDGAVEVKRQYVIRLQTRPGEAKFETMVEHDIRDNTFKLGGYISRLNRYQNQSWCMDDSTLKLYCYCTG